MRARCSRTIGILLLGLTVTAGITAAQARPGGWGSERWDRSGAWGAEPGVPGGRAAGPVEGRVIVSRFTTPDRTALRPGPIAVTGAPTGSGLESRALAVYAAAVVDQFAQMHYRTDAPEASAGLLAELRVSHETVMPEEIRKPVSGAVGVGVSNRGTAYGMALNIDLSKPRAALIATTLEARIRDKASGKVLWEGRADINTREGDEHWSDGAIANKLAAALFDGFPGEGEVVAD